LNCLQKNPEVIDFLNSTNKAMGEKFPLTQAHFDGAYFRDLKSTTMLNVLKKVVHMAKSEHVSITTGNFCLIIFHF
jgi:hypothetical protein